MKELTLTVSYKNTAAGLWPSIDCSGIARPPHQ
jgi:hypothetical protein